MHSQGVQWEPFAFTQNNNFTFKRFFFFSWGEMGYVWDISFGSQRP